MASIDLALFLTLEGKGTEALAFYQNAFNGQLLFKMTFQEFKTQLAPDTVIETGTEHWLSHAVLQIGSTQMQLTDQPIDPKISYQKGNTLSLSVITDTIEEAQTVYEKLSHHPLSKPYQTPIQNEFADFYAILQDPFGLVIQITKEKTLSDK
ncbi:VOC family protein [Enterococcus sp.]|uniref:VOC family protein n=1 Tax=Enterococcus sp. TaxID=35783 RepID=UPI0025BBC217|nr:VOC family protein [Enterococcus sp.]